MLASGSGLAVVVVVGIDESVPLLITLRSPWVRCRTDVRGSTGAYAKTLSHLFRSPRS